MFNDQRPGKMGGNRRGSGPGGYCICPGCGTRIEHVAGVPCISVKCPKCGANMIKE